MQEDIKRLYVTLLIALIALFVFNKMFPQKELPKEEVNVTSVVENTVKPQQQDIVKLEEIKAPALSVDKALKEDTRISVKNDDLRGSIRLKGARIDNLYLKKYKNKIIQLGKGTAQQNLSLQDLNLLDVLNSFEEIKEFKNYDFYFEYLLNIKLKIKKLKEEKELLLKKYFG